MSAYKRILTVLNMYVYTHTASALSMYSIIIFIILLCWFSATDKNECLTPSSNRCQHECLNQMGAYACYCKMGYKLQADGFSCNRKF